MHSSPASRSNSVVKLFRRRSTASTSGVGESLEGDELLEWDRSDFSRHLPESDALSSYDVNEMAEILRNRFLEFDMSSQYGGKPSISRQSTINDASTPMSNYELTIEDFLKGNSFQPKLTFDIESICETSLIKRPFHRSLTDLHRNFRQESNLLSKHLSLMDVTSIEWTFLRNATPRAVLLAKANHRTSFSQIAQFIEPEQEPFFFSSKTSVNLSRLSRLAMFRLYMRRLREKLCSFVLQTIQPSTSNQRMPVISEETIETYDIIEQ